MRSLALTLCIILMLSCFTKAIDSQINFRIYRKTVQEVLRKNAPIITKYTSASLGTVDIADLTIENTILSIVPESEEIENKMNFVKNEGLEVTLEDLKFELTGTSEGSPVSLTGDVETLFFSLSIKNSEGEKNSDLLFDPESLPQFNIEKYEHKIDKSTFKWNINGEHNTDEKLLKATEEWIDAAIEGNMAVVKMIVNSAQSYIADYLSSTVDPETFKGKISFSSIIFHEEFAELGVISKFDEVENEHYEGTEAKDLPKYNGDDQTAVEILFDENIINSGLHSAFHNDGEFGLRDLLSIKDPNNQYSKMFDAVLVTNVISQAWKEIETEYGKNKK